MDQHERHRIVTDLVDEHLPALVLFARQWRHDSPEDVVQNAFVRLLKTVPFPSDPVAWLYTVIRNLSNNHLRTQKRRKNREAKAVSQHLCFIPSQSGNDEHEDLIRELQSLEHEYREIITLKIWSRLSLEQIAVVLNSSRSTIHRKYRQGLALLHDKLEESCHHEHRTNQSFAKWKSD